jgi:outer membrane protein assembly factor BamB
MARPSSVVNSTSAMFGFDLPHTHVNPSERILSAGTVSHLVPAWISHPGDVIYSSPAVANEVVYIGSDDGKLYAFDARTGVTRWSALTGRAIDSSPAVIHGMIYIGSRDHKVFAFHLLTRAIT